MVTASERVGYESVIVRSGKVDMHTHTHLSATRSNLGKEFMVRILEVLQQQGILARGTGASKGRIDPRLSIWMAQNRQASQPKRIPGPLLQVSQIS